MQKNFYKFILLVLILSTSHTNGFGQNLKYKSLSDIHLYPAKSNSRVAARLNRTTACSNDSVVLTRQSQIDSFPITNAACTSLRKLRIDGNGANPAITNLDSLKYITEITSDLEISHTSLTDLSGLSGLTYIGGWIWFDHDGTATSLNLNNLTHLGFLVLDSLPNLASVAGITGNLTEHNSGTFIVNNTGLSDLTDLEGIESIPNIYISGNRKLQSLHGLHNLKDCNYGISIYGNEMLEDISAFSQVTTIDMGTLEVSYNFKLQDLTALDKITTIGRGLWIEGNSQLTSLHTLNSNLLIRNDVHDENQQDNVRINWNGQLSACSFAPLCNYLSNGGEAEIHDNASGCSNLSEVLASCNTCTSGGIKTWTGSADNSWNEADNWSPAGVPQSCDTVLIPEGMSAYPQLENNVTIHGLTMESNTAIDFVNRTMIINGDATLNSAHIYNGTSLSVNGANTIDINNSELNAVNLAIQHYRASLNFYNNTVYGNTTFTDDELRMSAASIGGNSFNGNLSVTANSGDYNATTNISGSGNDYVSGNATFTVRQPVSFSVGSSDDAFNVSGNLTVKSDFEDYPQLERITFTGGVGLERIAQQRQLIGTHITQSGSARLKIANAKASKSSSGNYIILDQDVYITNNFHFENGIVITEPARLLIFNDNTGISQYTSGSYVWGPVKKIGDDAFTFPVGDENHWGLCSITAPSLSTDVFTAQYFGQYPGNAGYDTSLHANTVNGVLGKEYWMINRTSGNSNVGVTLRYDVNLSGGVRQLTDLRVVRWDSSRWQNEGLGSVTGTFDLADVMSNGNVSGFGPFALGFIPTKIPIITIGNMGSLACRNQTFKIPFSVDTAMLADNTFYAQLSDSTGSFANPITIGQLKSNHSDTISAYIGYNYPLSSNYLLRVIGSSPLDTSINTKPVKVSAPPNNFAITGPASPCVSSSPYKYYASIKQTGVTYTWTLYNGNGVMTTNNDTAYITWKGPGGFSLGLKATNECSTIESDMYGSLLPPPPPDTPALNKIGRQLYATALLPLHAAGYHWYKNNALIAGVNSSTYYASAAGTYTVNFYNDCGESPASNAIVFALSSVPQTINFPTIPDKTFSDSSFVINASTSSGLPLLFTIVSGPGSVTGNNYIITGTGTVTIKAMQPGDDVYDTASSVIQTFVVKKATQTIDFTAIPDRILGAPHINLSATASSGLAVTYIVVSGPATLYGNQLTINGIGNITVSASQSGDKNYLAATSANRTFCVRVTELTNISGPQYVCPGQSAIYSINKVVGLTYKWRLSNETTFSSISDSATITLTTPGSYTLIVSGSGACGAPTANDSLVVNVINPVTPGAVSNMLPANGVIDRALPLTLSWIPGSNVLSYDLYVWDSATVQPTVPFASDIIAFSYTIPNGTLTYSKTYKWKVVSKNACLQTSGSSQQFRLKPLPDLVATDVQTPSSAFSGQTINISWKVSNAGPGRTTTNQSWTDAVFLSFDSVPNFNIPPNTNAAAWSQLDFPVRPLLIGTKTNVSALDSGQQYTSSINFTLPRNYSQPLYAYIITNYPAGNSAPLQMAYSNDTAHAKEPVMVTLSPTPDLRVDTILTPKSVFSGSTVNVTYKVKNFGVLTPAGSSWSDKFYLSQSPLFNLENAIPLKFKKANGSYYPNAQDAIPTNNRQLLADSSYTKSVEVVMPNFLFGTFFIHVVTNYSKTVYEGALENNNVNGSEVQIFLTPTPQLTINSLTVPVTVASTTQPIGVNWNIYNAGFYDNIELNKGHYFVSAGICSLPGNCSSSPCPAAIGASWRDSLGWGSSYWVDKIYLSTDSSGLNSANAIFIADLKHGIENSALQYPDDAQNQCLSIGSIAPAPLNAFNIVKPLSNYPGTYNFTVPADLREGNYYVYIFTNATKKVYEYPGKAQIRRSDAPIVVKRPDVSVPSVTVPANSIGGQQLTLQYQIMNSGAGSIFNTARKDRIYISTSSVFDATAQLLATQNFTENIPAGSSISHSFDYTLPQSTSGARYFYVHTNFDSSFRENNYNNNISAPASTSVTLASPNDLIVSNIQLADTVFSIYNNYLKYTVANNGTGITAGTWTDSVFISCSPAFNPANSYFINKRTHNNVVSRDSSYSDSFNVVIPYAFNINNCFSTATYSNAYFFIKTNADNIVFEGSNLNNNVTGSGLRVLVNPLVDHVVTSVTGPDTATVARPYIATWTVKNIGYNPGTNYYYSWYDAIYFSLDSAFNNKAVLATYFSEDARLARNQSYSRTRGAIPPNISTGDYYVFAVSNYANGITGEKVATNNANLIRNSSGTAKKIHVIQPLLPDLADTITDAPSLVAVGQPLTVVHTTKNIGAGVTYPNNWSNETWLSNDFIPGNGGDIKISGKNVSAVLQPGASVSDTATTTININTVPGNYILITKIDAANNVFESNDTNNLAFRYVTIYSPSPADLTVEQVTKPDTVYLGYTIDSVKWIIKNNSPNNATGISSDGIYLSGSPVLDSTAALLSVVNKNINIPALDKDTVAYSALVTNVVEGNYNVLIKTDLLNNIVESNKSNNVGLAAGSIYVKVKELQLNVQENNTLQNINRYYKLAIPDSLRGSTILVTLKTNDSSLVRNEMFIGAGYVPTPAKFDYKFETANYGNQQIVMTSVEDPIYYIMYRSVSSNSPIQNVTLQAVKLPFAILTVQSNSGGNTGNVTVRINGSLFTNNMRARLNKAGTTIDASAVYFINSTTAYATFNLRGQSLGAYDVSLIKLDTSIAVLSNGFSIVPANNGGLITGGGTNSGQSSSGTEPGCDPGATSGLNAQLVTEVVIPPKAFAGWSFVIQINYSNPTNVDIPAQVRILYNDKGIPVALTQAGLDQGKTSLYMEFTETGGPPGIIRAGGSGTLNVYAKAPANTPGHTVVNFNLK